MKLLKYAVSLILIVTLIVPIVCYAESNDSITYDEAWDLLERAYSLSCYVNSQKALVAGHFHCKYDLKNLTTDYRDYKNEIIYGSSAINAFIEFAEATYTEPLVENSWKWNYILKDEPSYLTITEEYIDSNPDELPGTSWYWGYKLLKKETDWGAYTCLLNNVLTFEINEAGYAAATVIMERNSLCPGGNANDPDAVGDVGSVPVKVSVEFTRTAEGWRISGGEFVNAMCDVKKCRYTKINDDLLYWYSCIYEILDPLINDTGFTTETYYINNPNFKCSFLSNDYVKWIIKLNFTTSSGITIDGEYTAYFKYVTCDINSEYADNPPYTVIEKKSNDKNKRRYLVFYGGSLYDLLVNGNIDAETFHGEASAYTGDDIQQSEIYFWSISAGVSLIAGAWLIIRRKKKTIV